MAAEDLESAVALAVRNRGASGAAEALRRGRGAELPSRD
jgi:hypothetical protein